MSLDLVVKSAVREVVREEIRAALAELKLTAADQFMTYGEAAAFVGCCVATVTKWVQDGALKSYGRERTIRVLRSELIAAMELQEQTQAETPDQVVERLMAKRRR